MLKGGGNFQFCPYFKARSGSAGPIFRFLARFSRLGGQVSLLRGRAASPAA